MTTPDRDKFERLMHVTFNLVGDAMGWPTKNVRAWLALETGHCDAIFWPPGSDAVQFVPHSIRDMDMAELESFWQDARAVIRKDVLPHTPPVLAEQITIRLESLE
jgi:hypothetical protein